ncbi:MAG TPA: ABC transporter permease [Halothiobacillaceae bacterium]|nr:ABC transporter permease [Halothiobacillaceae bacterium]
MKKQTAKHSQVPRQNRAHLSAPLRAWRNHHRECFRHAWRRLRDRPVGAWATILVLAVVLALPALIISISAHIERIGGIWLSDTAQMDVFVSPSIEMAVLSELQQSLQQDNRVAEVTLISPEQGLADLAEHLQLGQLSTASDNPLPYVLHLQLTSNDIQLRESLVADVKSKESVTHITDGGEWTQRLAQLQKLTYELGWWLMSLLGLAALFVVGNTLRLELYERRRELALISLIGGTKSYILRPVLYDGAVTGFVGGIVAAILVAFLFRSVAIPMQAFAESYGTTMPAHVDFSTLISIVAIATALGWLSAQLIGRFYIRKLARV